jgi:phosphatidylglycerophosphatase A
MTSGSAPTTPIILTQRKPRISYLVATWFGLGYLPKAPGTWGSLGGWIIAALTTWLVHARMTSSTTMAKGGPALATYVHVVVTLFIAVIGVMAADRAARYAQIKDPQWVVVDEVSGQLITYHLFFLVMPLYWKTYLLGFILFRLFDIWKPFPTRQLERLPGGWGIMADDWMAGIYAAIVLRVALHFRVL